MTVLYFSECPTVDSFTGHVTQGGKPISLPPGSKVQVRLYHEQGQSFGIPIKEDGSFVIGWMPIGKYAVIVESPPKGAKGPALKYTAPDSLTIKEGKTEYNIEIDKDWKL